MEDQVCVAVRMDMEMCEFIFYMCLSTDKYDE
jgi:hypothetical protein